MEYGILKSQKVFVMPAAAMYPGKFHSTIYQYTLIEHSSVFTLLTDRLNAAT